MIEKEHRRAANVAAVQCRTSTFVSVNNVRMDLHPFLATVGITTNIFIVATGSISMHEKHRYLVY